MESVKTSLGELRCYRNEGGDFPGFSVYFVPDGSEKEINIAMIQVPENDEDTLKENKVLAYIKEQYVTPKMY